MGDIVKQIKGQPALRESFMSLARRIFDLDFKLWYEAGFWSDKYIPYSIVEDGAVVANASVNLMDFVHLGSQRRYIQIGTVMTDGEYRGRGFARRLLTEIIADWKDRCDGIYLFANSTVLDFYPKFGFVRVCEHEYAFEVSETGPEGVSLGKAADKSGKWELEKLNMDSNEGRALLYRCYEKGNPFSQMWMKDNQGLLMFYCCSFLKDCVYYVPAAGLVVVAQQDGNEWIVYDIFGEMKESVVPEKEGVSTLRSFLSRLCQDFGSGKTRKIRLGFTPLDKECFVRRSAGGDDTLFVLAQKENPFGASQGMFPLLSHA